MTLLAMTCIQLRNQTGQIYGEPLLEEIVSSISGTDQRIKRKGAIKELFGEGYDAVTLKENENPKYADVHKLTKSGLSYLVKIHSPWEVLEEIYRSQSVLGRLALSHAAVPIARTFVHDNYGEKNRVVIRRYQDVPTLNQVPLAEGLTLASACRSRLIVSGFGLIPLTREDLPNFVKDPIYGGMLLDYNMITSF
ncbi:MAG: hypothetical protein HGA85_04025 [Nanoarchaeota archaeon]|nr:hypothetical protein [Nanoarchaeota archaeon]